MESPTLDNPNLSVCNRGGSRVCENFLFFLLQLIQWELSEEEDRRCRCYERQRVKGRGNSRDGSRAWDLASLTSLLEMSEDTPQTDTSQEDLHSLPRSQILRKRGDLTDWQGLIGSILEELKVAYPVHYKGTGPTPQGWGEPDSPGNRQHSRDIQSHAHVALRPGGPTGNEFIFWSTQ